MCNYDLLKSLINNNTFNLESIIDYYISYVSIFNCKDIVLDDEIKYKVEDLKSYIENKIRN